MKNCLNNKLFLLQILMLLKLLMNQQLLRLKLLNKKLAKAIESEDFEQAAKLRDELKDLPPRPAEPAKK